MAKSACSPLMGMWVTSGANVYIPPTGGANPAHRMFSMMFHPCFDKWPLTHRHMNHWPKYRSSALEKKTLEWCSGQIGGWLKDIHDRLDGAIAVVAIQKNPGNDTGLGGYRSMEVTLLALALDYGRVKVTKAKNFAGDQNPNGWVKPFKLVNGCRIIDKHGWTRETKKGGELWNWDVSKREG